MDTLAHAVVGLAVAGLSGHHPSLGDPVYIATMLGAQAPDFDLVTQLRGNIVFLKQHRSFSHSIPGIAALALAIAMTITLLLPAAIFWPTFFWTLAGGLSHITIDYFNTHGVAILWPFRRERKSYPLLKVFDPFALLIMLAPYAWHRPMPNTSFVTLSGLMLYILLRYVLRKRAVSRLTSQFAGQNLRRLWVMPSLTNWLFWDFVAETAKRHINGQLGLLSPSVEIQAVLPRRYGSELTEKAEKTVLGQFFLTFTPFTYFEEHPESFPHKVNIYDLRYFSGQEFIHSATVVFNKEDTPCETYIHSLGRTIRVQPTA